MELTHLLKQTLTREYISLTIRSNHIDYNLPYDAFVIILTLAFGDSDMAKAWKLKKRGVTAFSRTLRKSHKRYEYQNYKLIL